MKSVAKRIDIQAVMADPATRRDIFIRAAIAAFASEGIVRTYEQMGEAYDRIQAEKKRLEE